MHTYLTGPDYDSVLVFGCRSHDTIKLHYFIGYPLPFEGDGNWTNIFINAKEVLMIYSVHVLDYREHAYSVFLLKIRHENNNIALASPNS